tara:strand:+ start:2299 stop:2568 length:270 start_codon:yes stop_codon:yes gene_type:complete
MLTLKTGDLIAKNHPSIEGPIKIGIVISNTTEGFTVKWTSYNKNFFMEKEADIFSELNKAFLLNIETIATRHVDTSLSLLNSSYIDDQC